MIRIWLLALLLVGVSLCAVPISAQSIAAPQGQHQIAQSDNSSGTLSSHPTPEERKELLREILSRREFEPSLFDRLAEAIEKIWNQFWKSIEDFFGQYSSEANKQEPSSLYLLLARTVLVALPIVILVIILRRVRIQRTHQRQLELDELYAGPDSAKDALREAELAAASEDFRTSLRLVFLAILLQLDDQELIVFDRKRTNWEYLARISEHKDLHSTLKPIALIFDRRWYGHERATDTDYRSFLEAYRFVARSGVGV